MRSILTRRRGSLAGRRSAPSRFARPRPWRWVARVLLAIGLAAVALFAVLCTPQPFFAHHVSFGRYRVWSDRPIPRQIAGVLDDVTRRLARSDLYTPDQRFRIFLCNDEWRLALYSWHFQGGMGGTTDGAFTQNVYIRRSDVALNRLIPRQGWTAEKMAGRPLSYYIAHELTHVLEARAFGRTDGLRYPRWLREGYADYVGKGGDFDLAANARLLRAGAPALDPKVSHLYLRYHLEVAYLMDRKHRTIRQIFADPPDEATLLAQIKADPTL
jgi:hypothetical protein